MEVSKTCVTFNNGIKCPILGLGTWQSEPGNITAAIKDAIDAGYRHFDCAFIYGNEKQVGEGLKQKIEEGVVKREDLFVTSKLWNTYHRADMVKAAVRESLSNLQLTYLDLYLMHWPIAFKEGGDLFPKNEHGELIGSEVPFTETWKEMEKLVEEEFVKSIGVSNFNSQQIDKLLAVAKIKPVTNQVECHPYLNQNELKKFCESKGIVITAYSPLGSPNNHWITKDDPILLQDSTISNIATKYGKSVAQILIKYQIQRGNIVIPKSVSKSRIIDNANVFDFMLDDSDMSTLNSIGIKKRYCSVVDRQNLKDYPFHIEF